MINEELSNLIKNANSSAEYEFIVKSLKVKLCEPSADQLINFLNYGYKIKV
jgi:hypothetical protein